MSTTVSDLPEAQVRVLKALVKGGGTMQTSNVTNAKTVSGIASKPLEAAGLVKRSVYTFADGSTRCLEVTITAAGRKLADKAETPKAKRKPPTKSTAKAKPAVARKKVAKKPVKKVAKKTRRG